MLADLYARFLLGCANWDGGVVVVEVVGVAALVDQGDSGDDGVAA
jgi:hypothetical protein